ncbi:type II toxin-antitoxin system Phd/YefM family antitoxin [Rhizorhabdus dicambivorans]|nr:type II toxin-antitoxin system prevent-host-death family antitoxin [Rhizorhabdus dicambivorans]
MYVFTMDSISYSETRANLKAVMDKVVEDRAPVTITRARGQENVVMVSESEWASIEETLYLLRSPVNAARLLDAVRGLEAGGGEEHELIEP